MVSVSASARPLRPPAPVYFPHPDSYPRDHRIALGDEGFCPPVSTLFRTHPDLSEASCAEIERLGRRMLSGDLAPSSEWLKIPYEPVTAISFVREDDPIELFPYRTALLRREAYSNGGHRETAIVLVEPSPRWIVAWSGEGPPPPIAALAGSPG